MKYEFLLKRSNAGKPSQYYWAAILGPPKSWKDRILASQVFDTAVDANHFLREQATFLGIDFSKVNIIRELD